MSAFDDGMPQAPNIESYVRILIDKSAKRKLIFRATHAINRAMADQDMAEDIIGDIEKHIAELEISSHDHTLMRPGDVFDAYGGVAGFLQRAIDPRIPWGYPGAVSTSSPAARVPVRPRSAATSP